MGVMAKDKFAKNLKQNYGNLNNNEKELLKIKFKQVRTRRKRIYNQTS